MSGWLDKDALVGYSMKIVTKSDPKGIECITKRPDECFKYMDFISAALKFIGRSAVRKFGESDKFLTRKKDNEESRELREEGNKVYLADEKAQFYEEEALELYTESIAFATSNSREMAMGFANRSAVLLRLNRPMECLEDIERVLNSDYPEELMTKLLIRKAKCFSMLAEHSYIHAKFWLSKVSAEDPCLPKMKMELEGYSAEDYERVSDKREPILSEIESASAKFPCASDAIEYSELAGQKIVASRDIRVGEVLVVEEPYLTHPSEENHYCYCNFCLKSFWAGIPCDTCPNVFYCSENCKESAWNEYHSLECSAMNWLLQYEDDDEEYNSSVNTTASLRLLIKFSHEAGGLNALKERVGEFQKHKVLQDEWYKTQTLESVLALKSFIEDIPNELFHKVAAEAVQILFYLATTSDFLGIQYQRDHKSDKVILLEMSKNNDVQFVGGLLMRLLLIIRINSYEALDRLCESKYLDDNLVTRMIITNNIRGFMIPAFSQLITNSCYFNITEQFVGKYVIFHSVCPIKKGEEISKAPYCKFTWMIRPKKTRCSKRDKCSCRACVENWPTSDHLQSYQNRAKSSLFRSMLDGILEPLAFLHKGYCESPLSMPAANYDKDLCTLGRMMKAIHDGVQLPCKEQAMILNTLACFYRNTGMTSRWNTNRLDLIKGKQPEQRF